MNRIKEFIATEVCGIDFSDAPDFSDAYIERAIAIETDGNIRDATEIELETLNDSADFIYESVMSIIY